MTKNSASFLALCLTVSLAIIMTMISFHNPSVLQPIYQIRKPNQHHEGFQGLKPWSNRSSRINTAATQRPTLTNHKTSQIYSLQQGNSQLRVAVESLKLNERLLKGETTVDFFPCPDDMGGGKLQCQYYSPDWRGISDVQSILSKRIYRVRYVHFPCAHTCICIVPIFRSVCLGGYG